MDIAISLVAKRIGADGHDESRGKDSRAREQSGGWGQKSEIIQLYDELRPSLFQYLICLGLSPQSADDVIQETFLNLCRQMQMGNKPNKLRSWLFRVAHNLSLNLQKRESRMVAESDWEERATSIEKIDLTGTPEESLLKAEQQKRLEGALAKLTDQQRRCLHLRAEGLRYREIAETLGISISRVPQLLERAMAHLMDELYE